MHWSVRYVYKKKQASKNILIKVHCHMMVKQYIKTKDTNWIYFGFTSQTRIWMKEYKKKLP